MERRVAHLPPLAKNRRFTGKHSDSEGNAEGTNERISWLQCAWEGGRLKGKGWAISRQGLMQLFEENSAAAMVRGSAVSPLAFTAALPVAVAVPPPPFLRRATPPLQQAPLPPPPASPPPSATSGAPCSFPPSSNRLYYPQAHSLLGFQAYKRNIPLSLLGL